MRDGSLSTEAIGFLDRISSRYGSDVSNQCLATLESRGVGDTSQVLTLDSILAAIIDGREHEAGSRGFCGANGPFNSDD